MPTLQWTGQAPPFLSRNEEPGSAVPPAGLPSGAVCTLEAVPCPRCARLCVFDMDNITEDRRKSIATLTKMPASLLNEIEQLPQTESQELKNNQKET